MCKRIVTMKTMRELSREELDILYQNFVVYRDRECGGFAKMSSCDFYKKYGLEPYPREVHGGDHA